MGEHMKRVIVMVIDSVGIGELPDAACFGDEGANTLGSVLRTNPNLQIPNLLRLGIGRIENTGIDFGVGSDIGSGAGSDAGAEAFEPNDLIGSYGKAAEVSRGKDTTTGHWEITGIHSTVPFLTFPNGFPPAVIEPFEKAIGRKVLCNRPASGTEIIQELGELHMRTGEPIVYTSADSVFQIAAHEDVISLDELYRYCNIARQILVGEFSVARVIARPFVGKPGHFERTPNRRDYSVKPPRQTLLDDIKDSGMAVEAIGKIRDIFDGEGITEAFHTVSNADGMAKTVERILQDTAGMIFTNLVDFDSKYGHRRDPKGYGRALEEFDAALPNVFGAMKEEDLLIICADHGNDPCFPGTDHTREYIPILVYGKQIASGVNLGTRASFSDIGATAADYLNVPYSGKGESFLPLIRKRVEKISIQK